MKHGIAGARNGVAIIVTVPAIPTSESWSATGARLLRTECVLDLGSIMCGHACILTTVGSSLTVAVTMTADIGRRCLAVGRCDDRYSDLLSRIITKCREGSLLRIVVADATSSPPSSGSYSNDAGRHLR